MAANAALLKLCCIDQGRFKWKFCWAHLQSEDWVSCSTAVAAANWEMDTSPQSRSRQPEHEQDHTMVAEAGAKTWHLHPTPTTETNVLSLCVNGFRSIRLFVVLTLSP